MKRLPVKTKHPFPLPFAVRAVFLNVKKIGPAGCHPFFLREIVLFQEIYLSMEKLFSGGICIAKRRKQIDHGRIAEDRGTGLRLQKAVQKIDHGTGILSFRLF